MQTTTQGIALRSVFAGLLVFSNYNPSAVSYTSRTVRCLQRYRISMLVSSVLLLLEWHNDPVLVAQGDLLSTGISTSPPRRRIALQTAAPMTLMMVKAAIHKVQAWEGLRI